LFSLIGTSVKLMAQQGKQKTREEISEEYKWNLNDIFASWDEWEKSKETVEGMIEEIVALKGELKKGPQELKQALVLQEKLWKEAIRLYQYPNLMRSVDSKNAEVNKKLQEVQFIFAQFSTSTAWMTPELLSIPEETMMKWIDEDSEMEPYRFGMEQMYHNQTHVLTEEKENLLSYFSRANSTPSNIYSELSTSDIEYPTVELSDGSKMITTHGNLSRVLNYSKVQDDRRKMMEGHYEFYKKHENTYSALYNAVCQSDWASARARNYESCLNSALYGKNIPEEVYFNLVNTVKENTAPLKRYIKLRAKVLGLEGNYHKYDGSVSLSDFDKKYDYEKAKKDVLASVKPLGKEYQKKMKQAMSEGWLDVYEYDGKRPGAFSSGVYGVHPYMLLNYSGTMCDVFTLGHELGHTMHTLLADENQPFANHSYTIFVAEVASTFNERLLLEHMMDNATTPEERIALLTQAIDNIIGTFYAQTMFADYELQIHTMVEKGQPITAHTLSGVFKQLNNDYYGDVYEEDEIFDIVWSRIHHFYAMPYYVYQYATCFASSAKLYDDVTIGTKKEKEEALERYLNLLKSGGNDYPMSQLKKAGVDLTKSETIISVINQLDVLVDQLENELEKVKK
ncbi:MAG: oligoendopeptidase F, partial [Bacteroidota bacterium]|nr:oligoendopeptidase F [Bacteroidota bacterium]